MRRAAVWPRDYARRWGFRPRRAAGAGMALRGARSGENRPRGGTRRSRVVLLHRSGKRHGMRLRTGGRRAARHVPRGRATGRGAATGSQERRRHGRVGGARLAGGAPALGDRGDHLRGGAGCPRSGAERPADAPRRGRGPRGGLPALARAPDPGGGDPPRDHRALLVHPARGTGGGRALRLADPPRTRDPGARRTPSGAPAGAASCSGG